MNRDLRVLAAALFAMALGEGLFLPLAPLYMKELGAGPEQIGLVAALFALAQMVSMIPAGIASDRWGPRPVLLIGWCVAVLTAGMMAAAPNLALYAVGYAGYGLTFGVIPPLASAIANGRGGWTPERAFTRVYSFLWAGFVISPTIGGLIGEAYGLRTNYYIAVLMVLVSTLIMTRIGSSKPQPLQAGVRESAGLFRRRGYLFFLVIVFSISFSCWLGMPLAPNFLQEHWGISISHVGFLNSIGSAGGIAMALFLGGKGPRRVLVLLQVAVVGYLAIMLRTGQLGWLALAFVLQAGAMMTRQFTDAISTRIVHPGQLGLAYALNSSATRGATTVASALAGYLYAARPALPFQLGMALIPLVAILSWWKLPKAEGEEQQEGLGSPAGADLVSGDWMPR